MIRYNYVLDPRPEIISYAQNKEDIWLNILLGEKKKGFYVDVGANHPVHDSVTRFFYERGWHGVNVEPNARLAALLKQQRRRDITLRCAVGNASGEVVFREYLGKKHGLSTASEGMKDEHESENIAHKDYTIKSITLREIFSKYAPGSVDFLKIDVEGYEYEVIEGNDWDLYRPNIVVAEANHVSGMRDWTEILREHGYHQVFFDGLNVYFASQEYLPKVSFSRYPDIIIEGTPVITAQEFWRRDALLRRYEHVLQQAQERADDLKKQNTRLTKLIRMAVLNPPKFYAYLAYRRFKGRWPNMNKEGKGE